MGQFEIARIKILDKYTRQVEKEIDALTSDEAVYCDNYSITLKDKLKLLQKQSDDSSSSIITLIKNYDTIINDIKGDITNNHKLILELQNKNLIYDQKFLDIDSEITDINTEIKNIKKNISDDELSLEQYKNDLSKEIEAIKNKNTEQDNNIVNINNKNTEQDKKIDQAFQYANDGKINIASVIGSPAASNNTFAQLKNYIQTDKNTLATNLTNKGVSAKGNETLQSLAQKVGNIKIGYSKEEIQNNIGLIKLKVEKITKTRSELPNMTSDKLSLLSMQIKDGLICLSYRTPYGGMDHINYYFDKDLNLIKQVADADDNIDWGNLYNFTYKLKNEIKIKNLLTIDTTEYSFYHGSTASRTYVLYVNFKQSDNVIIHVDTYSDYNNGLFEYQGYAYLVLKDSIVRYNLYYTI